LAICGDVVELAARHVDDEVVGLVVGEGEAHAVHPVEGDLRQGHGPTDLHGYQASLAEVPLFVRLGTRDTGALMSALRRRGPG
jgi:hypothetical protein